jgi:hypothetical protein
LSRERLTQALVLVDGADTSGHLSIENKGQYKTFDSDCWLFVAGRKKERKRGMILRAE